MAYEPDRTTTTTTRADRPYSTTVTTESNGAMWAIIGGLVVVALGVLWYMGVFGDRDAVRPAAPATTIENNVNQAPAAPAADAPAAPDAAAPVQTAPDAAPAEPAVTPEPSPAAPAPAAPAPAP